MESGRGRAVAGVQRREMRSRWLHGVAVPGLLGCLTAALCVPGIAQQASASTAGGAQGVTAPVRDGQHDFDFNIGVWHTHIRRMLDPLSGSGKSMEMEGTVTVRPVWGGRAQLEEIEADGPNGHWEGLTLFLYNPQAHQWSQTFVDSKAGVLNASEVGSFHDGRGVLFAQDRVHDRAVLVRAVWSEIAADSHRFEEAYSADGGATWTPAFIAELTREKPGVPSGAEKAEAGSGDQKDAFAFDLGKWSTQSTRLLHPLTGSKTWVDLHGGTVVKPVWNGRANLAEYKAEGSGGSLELLALRFFTPATQEWNVVFATTGVGVLSVPCVGAFKGGRGDFYDYEAIDGRFVLVRFSIWTTGADTGQSEQAFSADGGKTWEVNWINRYTRPRG